MCVKLGYAELIFLNGAECHLVLLDQKYFKIKFCVSQSLESNILHMHISSQEQLGNY